MGLFRLEGGDEIGYFSQKRSEHFSFELNDEERGDKVTDLGGNFEELNSDGIKAPNNSRFSSGSTLEELKNQQSLQMLELNKIIGLKEN